MSPKKMTSNPLDQEKTYPADIQDPRSDPSCWPCKGEHGPLQTGSNGYGQWKDCRVCGLRVQYTPRVGYHGHHKSQVEYTVVRRALTQLQKDLGSCKPTMDLAKTTMAIFEKEDRIKGLQRQIATFQDEVQSLNQQYHRAVTQLKDNPVVSSSRDQNQSLLEHFDPRRDPGIASSRTPSPDSKFDSVRGSGDGVDSRANHLGPELRPSAMSPEKPVVSPCMPVEVSDRGFTKTVDLSDSHMNSSFQALCDPEPRCENESSVSEKEVAVLDEMALTNAVKLGRKHHRKKGQGSCSCKSMHGSGSKFHS